MIKIILRLILIAFLFLPGCYSYSDNPLSAPDVIDNSIIGTWYPEAEEGLLHIAKDKDSKSLVITIIDFRNDGTVETTELRGHTTKLSSYNFLNLKRAKPDDTEDTGYFFIAYKIENNTLEYSLINLEIFKKGISQGSLKGEIQSTGKLFSPRVRVHATQEELQKFILQNEKELMKDTIKLKKLTLQKNGRAE